jgi:hypothetical protein
MDFAFSKKNEMIELNKFSKLHNGSDIFFCKTDYLFNEFEKISELSNEVILITGNSDYPIDEFKFNRRPKNIKKWYAQNALVNHEILEPIPIGIENKYPSIREGHGIGYYDRVDKKENLLSRNLSVIPTKGIYSNFQIDTNYSHRVLVKNISLKSNHIDWHEPNLSLDEFFNTILDYEMVICPSGNGVDTHRLWEVLYSNRIPITVKVGDYKIYELYEKYPIIILDNVHDLENEKLIYNKFEIIKNKNYNREELDCDFWLEKIKNIKIK